MADARRAHRLRWVIALCCALAVAALAHGCRRFLEVDRCLDAGGRWDDASDRCDGARTG